MLIGRRKKTEIGDGISECYDQHTTQLLKKFVLFRVFRG